MVDITVGGSEPRLNQLQSQWNEKFITDPFYANMDLHDEPVNIYRNTM